MNQLLKWAKKEYSLRQRLFALIPAAFVFLILIPWALVSLIPHMDAFFHFPRFDLGVGNLILGIVFLLPGGFFALWSIGEQLFEAGGTPMPMMPTQTLLASGPFRLCRNPMTFGTITAYLGVAIWTGSLASILMVLLFGSMLVMYIRNIEEKELEARFGQPYTEYKQNTPFLLPGLPRGNKSKRTEGKNDI